jgi:hypothetical protein
MSRLPMLPGSRVLAAAGRVSRPEDPRSVPLNAGRILSGTVRTGRKGPHCEIFRLSNIIGC